MKRETKHKVETRNTKIETDKKERDLEKMNQTEEKKGKQTDAPRVKRQSK